METAVEFMGADMLNDLMIRVAPPLAVCLISIALNEWRFRAGQKKMLIKEIVGSFLKLRKETQNNQVYELRYLQSSGILLLKRERDAQEVLRQIELRDKRVDIPNFISKEGILQGLKLAIKKGINIEDFTEVTTEEIREGIKKFESI